MELACYTLVLWRRHIKTYMSARVLDLFAVVWDLLCILLVYLCDCASLAFLELSAQFYTKSLGCGYPGNLPI